MEKMEIKSIKRKHNVGFLKHKKLKMTENAAEFQLFQVEGP